MWLQREEGWVPARCCRRVIEEGLCECGEIIFSLMVLFLPHLRGGFRSGGVNLPDSGLYLERGG